MMEIFSIFFHQTTFCQKKFILSITILFGLLSPGLIGLAIWFKQPVFNCKTSQGITFECTQEQACSGEYLYWVDYAKSALSITTELSLFCGYRYMKRVLVSCYFFGGVIGCIMNIAVYVPARGRKLALGCLGFLQGLTNLGMVLCGDQAEIMMFLLGFLSFTWIIMHSYSFMIVNENFKGDVAKSVIMIMMVFWGICGIIYSILAYFFDASYKILFFLLAVIGIVDSIFLFFQRLETEPVALTKKHGNFCSSLKEVWNVKQIAFNVFCFVISWSAFCVTYNDVFLRLETIGGSLYLNMALISGFEMSASFVSGILSLKYNIANCIKAFMFCEMICGIIFLFAPIEVKHLSLVESTILLLFMIATKFFSDLINNLINLYAPKIFTDEFVGLFLILSRFCSRIFLFLLPTVNYGFEIVGIHPLFFLTILWGLCFLMTLKTKEIQEEGVHEVLQEFKVKLTTRASVIYSLEHSHVDDVLSNVIVDDKKLSEIRKSRILRSASQENFRSHDKNQIVKSFISTGNIDSLIEMKLIEHNSSFS